ncbi:pentapeptide repeat-containing protein [Streptomyces sp. NPDC058595]|uniref:pentapeptide repeat-containing protein n=1 Tax=Streptomyces sp. NPDC058595 TaxID=3346550 RepID=UPI003658A6BD
MAHLADADCDAYLAGLTPGTDIDHRGTPFTEPLLDALLNALRDPATGYPRLGNADFKSATFEGRARFDKATFEGHAGFRLATFQGSASFVSATFQRNIDYAGATFQGGAVFRLATFQRSAWFESVTFQRSASFRDADFSRAIFERDAWFGSANFEGSASFGSTTFQRSANYGSATFQSKADFGFATFQHASFVSTTFQRSVDYGSATFQGGAVFRLAIFEADAGFMSATFKGDTGFMSAIFKDTARFETATFEAAAEFEAATFEGDAQFEQAVFERAVSLGPLVCAGRVKLSGAVFSGPVTLSFAALRLECRRTRWSSTAELRLRYATVDFSHAVFEYPLTIAAEADPFVRPGGQPVAEEALTGAPGSTVRMASLRGVDAAHLVLADVDLSGCLFTGTVHLDQIRLEGACVFGTVPPAMHWRGWRPVRFTQRRTLAEEHHWRASQPAAVPGWNVAVFDAGRVGPLQLAPVYRALRKAFEDGKHEPGAADFYYAEMEMRRHADDIPLSERSLLTVYWALSGYGMRASRALVWLAAAMLGTIFLLMGLGIPQDTPKQEVTGTVPAGGGRVTFTIDKADPQNPTGDRFTGERFEKALTVTLNSVVFRSSGQDLTTTGTYTEMASRVTEPVLLGLAVLAVRNRVKR